MLRPGFGAEGGIQCFVDQALLQETPKAPERNVFVAANETHQLRRRGEAVTQDCLDDVQVSVVGRLQNKAKRANKIGFLSWFGTRGSEVQILSPPP